MPNVLLKCRNVSFGYGEGAVLGGITLSIAEGDLVGVIGPNGAGKSTLVRVLSGLLSPCEGIITLNGADMRSLGKRTVASQLAVIQQEETSEFGFSVTDHVMMGRAPHHGGLYFENSEDRAIAEEAMKKARVSHLAGRLMETLSGGERQRVRIARALAQQPRILFLDEPTNHLDLYSQMSLIELIREINSEGMAILTVSHDINFMSACGGYLRIVHEGKFRSEGLPCEVITEENLARWFGIKALVDVNPVSGAPRMTALSRLGPEM